MSQANSSNSFQEAERLWDLERLYGDLDKIPSPNAKLFLKGVLLGYTPKEIGEQQGYTGNRPGETVSRTLSDEIYGSVENLCGTRPSGYRTLPKLLEAYKIAQPSLNASIKASDIDWSSICRKVLEKKRQPNITELIRTEEARFAVKDLFIPLGLIEKRQGKVKQGNNVSPVQGSSLYGPQSEEIKRRFDLADEFFETVIQGEQARRIIIIGEPGAGKTTILQKIATKLPENILPVWVSLADLRDQGLDKDFLAKYLFKGDWWKQVDQTVPTSAEEEFRQLFQEGRVCLLLDGVDEMTVAGGRSQLKVIYEQVQGWEAYVRVIMTCRVNVWETAPLSEEFEVYRNLPLEYPEQVEQYIDNFFENSALSGLPKKELKQELEGNDRVQDTVKNPLRLALLCHAWVHCGGKLPNTQAKLYELFLEAFYKIKQEQFYIEPDQQKALNQALGQLALEALDREQSWYRIDQVIAQRILGHPEQPGSFFYQALQLGLLNRIGYVAEDPSQECYAFIHPTFQEYLASLSPKIEGWHYFFNHNNKMPNPLVPYQGHDCIYRILEPHWPQVASFWLESINLTKNLNDRIVSDLWLFNSGFKDYDIDYDYIDIYYMQSALKSLSQISTILSSEIFEGYSITYKEEDTGIYYQDYCISLGEQLFFLDERFDEFCAYNYWVTDNQCNDLLTFESLVDFDFKQFKEIFDCEGKKYDKYDFGFGGCHYPDTKSFIQYLKTYIFRSNLDRLSENISLSHLAEISKSLPCKDIVCFVYDFLAHKEVDEDLINGIRSSQHDHFMKCLLWMLEDLQVPFKDQNIYEAAIEILIERIQTSSQVISRDTRRVVLKYLNTLLHAKAYEYFQNQLTRNGKQIICNIIKGITPQSLNMNNYCKHASHVSENQILADRTLKEILYWCSRTISYPQFYQAWHSSSSVHSELAEYTSVGPTPQAQQLNSQLLDLQTQLTPTTTTHPLCLDLSSLQTLSDRAELCQALALLSYEAIDPSFDTLDIPENIHTPTQLKTALLKLRKHLKTPKIAIIIHNSDPTPEILDILTVLSPSFPIAWITDQPHPHRSFLPTAANLPQLLQTWLDQIVGCINEM